MGLYTCTCIYMYIYINYIVVDFIAQRSMSCGPMDIAEHVDTKNSEDDYFYLHCWNLVKSLVAAVKRKAIKISQHNLPIIQDLASDWQTMR